MLIGPVGLSAAFAHPIETIKAKLQLQFSLDALKKSPDPSRAGPTANASVTTQVRSYTSSASLYQAPQQLYRERYTGPIDVVKQTIKVQGVRGMWKGFGATLWFRSSFAVSIIQGAGLSRKC
jgi:hypothetical protein